MLRNEVNDAHALSIRKHAKIFCDHVQKLLCMRCHVDHHAHVLAMCIKCLDSFAMATIDSPMNVLSIYSLPRRLVQNGLVKKKARKGYLNLCLNTTGQVTAISPTVGQ